MPVDFQIDNLMRWEGEFGSPGLRRMTEVVSGKSSVLGGTSEKAYRQLGILHVGSGCVIRLQRAIRGSSSD